MKLFLLSLALLVPYYANAQGEGLLNKLLAPGPLIEGHKKLETTGCLDCHDAGKGVPDDKCLTCHKEVRKFVDREKGFHGTLKQKCMECHKDHKGRNFDSTKFNLKKFNHNLTGFPLRGKHQDVKCNECHTKKRTDKHLRKEDPLFIGSSKSCKQCHIKEDIHKFQGRFAKKDCNACHGDQSWKENLKFNHDKDTDYNLSGAHKDLKCQTCHNPKGKKGPSVYEWKNLEVKKCLSCHSDQHAGKFSPKFQDGQCLKCHSDQKWKIKKFNHAITSYKLKGQHAKLKCAECHKQSKALRRASPKDFHWSGLKKKCSACHADYHKYANHNSVKQGPLGKCQTCHDEFTWKRPRFDHNRDTVFAITGKHKKVKCNECHVGKKWQTRKNKRLLIKRKYHWLNLKSKTCENCHKSPHKNDFSEKFLKKKCTECHVTSGWKDSPFNTGKTFDHSQTRFRLTGKHKTTSCNQCHKTEGGQIFKFKSVKNGFCVDCHKNPHERQFHKNFSEKNCTECHTTQKFTRIKKFNHSKTNFNLEGKHLKVNCTDCHTKTKRIKNTVDSRKNKAQPYWRKFVFHNFEKSKCTTCHNDYHDGQLSQSCTQCHTVEGWRKSRFSHNRDSDFALVGKHKKVKCAKCHEKIKGKYVKFGKPKRKYQVRRLKPLSDRCVSCHQKNDVHEGNFGQNCNECHIEKGWKKTKDFHRNFTLSGVHFTLDCTECHSNDRHLSGTSENCSFCHQKDDIHSGSLPQCGECHYESFWEHTRFRHSLTNFPLRGMHRTLDCFSCHNNGIYQGTPLSCTECHINNVDNSAFNHTPVINSQECNDCHNQFSFER